MVSSATILQILGALGGAGGALVAVVTIYRARADRHAVESTANLNEANASHIVSEATVVILNPLIAENGRLRERLTAAEARIDKLIVASAEKDAELERLRREIHDDRDHADLERNALQETIGRLQDRVVELESAAA